MDQASKERLGKDAAQKWREEPPSMAYELMNEEGGTAQIKATDDRERDEEALADMFGMHRDELPETDVQYFAWDPETAEAEWRQANCECEGDESHWTAPSYNAEGKITSPPEECVTTSPATKIWDFWDELGTYCPWVSVKADHKNAVAFRCVQLEI